MMKLLIVSALAGLASAACPNSCSGHGTCGPNEVAWVDAPDKDGKTHQYAECAARGICDREIGECECFGGFEGKGCGRQVCPDSCSGHGTCEYMNELNFGTVYNDYYDGASTAALGVGVGAVRPGTDYSWDADRARACVCDAGWTGINCASKMCPWGNDVMDTRMDRSTSLVYQVQTITLYSGGSDGGQKTSDGNTPPVYSYTTQGITDFISDSFALRFTSSTNETFTTIPVELVSADTAGLNDLADDIDAALENLPNRVITGVTVTAAEIKLDSGKGMAIKVTFDGDSVHGQQNLQRHRVRRRQLQLLRVRPPRQVRLRHRPVLLLRGLHRRGVHRPHRPRLNNPVCSD